jgi:hypothetical protein
MGGRPFRAGRLSSATAVASALSRHRQPTKLETRLVRIPFLSAKRSRRGNRPFQAYRRRDRGGLLVPADALPGQRRAPSRIRE